MEQALLERASRRLEAVAEAAGRAVEAAAEEESAAAEAAAEEGPAATGEDAVADGGVAGEELEESDRAPAPVYSRRTRKQRKAAARSATLRASAGL